MSTATTIPHDMSVRQASFGTLLGVEWRKSLDTPSARWLVIVVVIATIGATMLGTVLSEAGTAPLAALIAAAAFAPGLLLPVVPLMSVASEWSQRTGVVTFVQEPRRNRVLAAKLVAGVLLGLIGAAFAALVALGVLATGGLGMSGIDSSRLVGFVLFMVISMLAGFAYGALLHNTPAAIVALIGPSLAMGLIGDAGVLGAARPWLDHSQAFRSVLNAQWQDGRWAPLATAVLIWVGIPLAVGWWRSTRRPVG